MSDKINIQEYFKKYSNLYQFEEGAPEYMLDKEDFANAVKEIVEAVVDKCLDHAKAKENPADFGTGEIWVDPQSILQVKQMIDYE
jgi:hypothetical protein